MIYLLIAMDQRSNQKANEMNTYRVYVLETTIASSPVAHVAFVKSEKYADAWRNARAALNRSDERATLYNDADCKSRATFAKNCVVAKIDDIKPRNKKIDKIALTAIINDPKSTPEQKIAALTQIVT